MKRSRAELINSVVGSYLRKRQFTETEVFKKNDLKQHQTTQEMATRGLISSESSLRNTVNFSSALCVAGQIDHQFSKFKTFVSESVEPYKTELTYTLYPFFIHLYLELIHNGQKTIAQKFFQHYQLLFSMVPNSNEMLDSLKKINTVNDISSFQNVKAFRENKYVVELTEDCLHYLLQFLKDNDNLILLQIFNFHIEVKEPSILKLHLFDEKNQSTNQTPKSTESKPPPSSAMKSLLQCIKKVREGSLPFPSVCLYTIKNTAQGVSCTELNQDMTLLAAGYEDSSIHLWSLTPSALKCDSPASSTSVLRFGYDIETEPDENTSYEDKIMRGHCGAVHSLCFTPDSQLMLSCSEDTTVRAWDMHSYSNVALYQGHNYPVWDIDYSSLGVYFATASHDRTAKLWTLDRTYPIRYFTGHTMDVDSIRFHPNCNYVATGSSDRSVRLWSVQDGKMVRIFHGHRGTIFTLAFSPNGQFLASAGEDRRVKIWDLGSGTLLKELRGHVDTVYSLCFNRDSSILISAGLDSNVKIWDIRKGVNSTSGIDGHTSPELLGSCFAKSTNLLTVRYSTRNHLVAVGMQPS